jgi:hypothetical protein
MSNERKPAAWSISRFVDRDERPLRGVGIAMLLSLPVWIGVAGAFLLT